MTKQEPKPKVQVKKEKDNAQINAEDYKINLQEKVELKQWAEKFIETEDWKKLAGFITQAFPNQSPYSLPNMEEIKHQGGIIKGLQYPETLLRSLIFEGTEAEKELKTIAENSAQ